MGGWSEQAAGASVPPLLPALLAGRGLLMVSGEAKGWFWRGLCRSMEAGEEEEEEEEGDEEVGRGRSGGEAGRLLGFSFSIMVVKSLGRPRQRQASLPPCCSVAVPQCVCWVFPAECAWECVV